MGLVNRYTLSVGKECECCINVYLMLCRCLGKGMNAMVEIQTQRPVALELYKDFKELGRFMLRYVGSTIAAGVVTEIKE
nr:HBS1-like protein [Oncorhynchus nerka]